MLFLVCIYLRSVAGVTTFIRHLTVSDNICRRRSVADIMRLAHRVRTCDECGRSGKAGIPRHRHRQPRRHPREDRREDVGVGDVECKLKKAVAAHLTAQSGRVIVSLKPCSHRSSHLI